MSMSLSKDIDHLAITTAPSPTTNGRNEIQLVDKTSEGLTAEVLPTILSFLTPIEIMRARRVCTTWRDAAKKALVLLTDFKVDSVISYNAMRAMSTDLPSLQHLWIRSFAQFEERRKYKYSDGEDPDEDEAADTANFTTHDINVISNFTKLRSLEIDNAPLNGRYPVLFNLPLLQKLRISNCCHLKWDLEMLAGLPSLKEFVVYRDQNVTGNLRSLRMIKDNLEEISITNCPNFVGDLDMLEGFSSLRELALINKHLTGNISSLRAVKDTIIKVKLECWNDRHIEGNFMDLADFPLLKELDLRLTSVTGDFRDSIRAREHDFPSLEKLILPWCRIERVSDVPGVRIASAGLRNFEHLTITSFVYGHKYSDGEDPDEEEAARTANYITHDINIISNFTNLRSLEIDNAPLNGRYPVLFNFPLLHTLRINDCDLERRISDCDNLKFDLDVLAGLPSLKEFVVYFDKNVTGDLRSLRVLKDTLEKVQISSINVRGNFMDLADFPRLMVLDLGETNVTGDIRDIKGHDFPALERLNLTESVHGGQCYEVQSIAEVPSFMHAIHLLLQRNPSMFSLVHTHRSGHSHNSLYYLRLSPHSSDRYAFDHGEIRTKHPHRDYEDERDLPPLPPFKLLVIRVGSRLGWSWCSDSSCYYYTESCEINWVDPEPRKGSIEYEAYIEELHRPWISIDFYRGHHQPPTKEKYHHLCERYLERHWDVYWERHWDGKTPLDNSEELKELLSRKGETRLAQKKKKKSRSKKTRKRGKRTKQKNDPIIDTQPDCILSPKLWKSNRMHNNRR